MTQKPLAGVVLDEGYELSITEICHACGSSTEWVVNLVQEGVLEPIGDREEDWRFPSTSLRRARTATRLQQDLGVNLAGIAVALDMMEELEKLRARLQRLDPDSAF